MENFLKYFKVQRAEAIIIASVCEILCRMGSAIKETLINAFVDGHVLST